jgi:hypothetical protein
MAESKKSGLFSGGAAETYKRFNKIVMVGAFLGALILPAALAETAAAVGTMQIVENNLIEDHIIRRKKNN